MAFTVAAERRAGVFVVARAALVLVVARLVVFLAVVAFPVPFSEESVVAFLRVTVVLFLAAVAFFVVALVFLVVAFFVAPLVVLAVAFLRLVPAGVAEAAS